MRTIVLQTMFYSPDQERDDHGRFGQGSREQARFASPDDANDWAESRFTSHGSSAEQGAFSRYQGSGHSLINSELRGNTTADVSPRALEAAHEVVGPLDDVIARNTVDRDVEVYRGMDLRDTGIDPKTLVGSVLSDKAFQSTSFDERVATRSFSARSEHGAVFRILVPAGTNAMYVKSMTGEDGEKELLLGRNTSYSITSVQRDEYNRYIFNAEVVK